MELAKKSVLLDTVFVKIKRKIVPNPKNRAFFQAGVRFSLIIADVLKICYNTRVGKFVKIFKRKQLVKGYYE